MPRDLYAVLGVAPAASGGEITRAYRRLLRRYHPDTRRDSGDTAQADAALGEVLNAYTVLHDPVRRAEYDQHRAQSPTRPASSSIPVRVTDTSSEAGRIPVRSRTASGPPLWVGPVRWHPGRGR